MSVSIELMKSIPEPNWLVSLSNKHQQSDKLTMGVIGDQIQVLGWIVAAMAVAFYGNGETDLLTLIFHDNRLNR